MEELIKTIAGNSITGALLIGVLWWLFNVKQRADERMLCYMIALMGNLSKLEMIILEVLANGSMTADEKRALTQRLTAMIEELIRDARNAR
jgi:hypothetical protein